MGDRCLTMTRGMGPGTTVFLTPDDKMSYDTLNTPKKKLEGTLLSVIRDIRNTYQERE